MSDADAETFQQIDFSGVCKNDVRGNRPVVQKTNFCKIFDRARAVLFSNVGDLGFRFGDVNDNGRT
jgi:hypothetical protein